jgi:hypothetical protein
MMDHARYRAAIIVDPRSDDPELARHREACPECSSYTEELQRFEARLEQALRVDIPVRSNVVPFMNWARARKVPVQKQDAWRPRRLPAIAAALIAGALIPLAVWIGVPGRSLAADVVAHMAGEPAAWRRTDTGVPASQLDAVLGASNLRLTAQAGTVSYASSCSFRGYLVPHLVVQTGSGPVTVMVLVHERTGRLTQFDEQGYRGTIVPVPGHGSIAVLVQDPAAAGADAAPTAVDVQRIAARVLQAIQWMN